MNCNFNFSIFDVCTKRFGIPVKGRDGRGNCAIKGIVLHKVRLPYAEYLAEMQRDIPSSFIFTDPVYPRSVHYLFDEFGNAVRAVVDENPAWGLNNLLFPTQRALNLIVNQAYPDLSLLHIAIDSAGFTQNSISNIAKLICCLCIEYGIPADADHIVDAVEFNEDEDYLGGVPLQLFQLVTSCIQAGGNQSPQDPIPAGLAQTILELRACCADKETKITALTQRVAVLETQATQAQTDITNLLGRVFALESNQLPTTALPAIYAQINTLTQAVEKLKVCASKVCGDECPPTTCRNIHYRIDREEQYQLIPPLVNTWLFANGSTKIDDSVPPQVLNSALWTAQLSCSCAWKISISVHIQMRDWCASKEIWIDMVTDTGRFRIATSQQTGGLDAPTLTGSTVLVVPPDANVHFEIASNDNRMAQIIVDYADVQITC